MSEKRTYSKPYLPLADQVALLEGRGLTVDDAAAAADFFRHNSYYRVSAYTYYFEEPTDDGHRSHRFLPGTSFADVNSLYRFDHDLRIVCLRALEQIEVSFKTVFCYKLAKRHGPHWYEDPSLFGDPDRHAEFLGTLDADLPKKAKAETFIGHYLREYCSPARPPCWMVLEIVSFGSASRLFANLCDHTSAKAVASVFGLHLPVLKSWLHSLVVLRNHCAHNSRIWNRIFPFEPKIPRHPAPYLRPGNQFYHFAQLMRHMLQAQGRHSEWTNALASLLCGRTDTEQIEMGFRTPIQKEALWV